jgi:hypothetical protein
MMNEFIGRGWAFPPRIGLHGVVLTDAHNEINQAIQIILMTPLGQRVMRPTFGCRIHELGFAPNNNQTAAQAQRYVEEALNMWEPRVNLKRVRVENFDPNDTSKNSRHKLWIEIEYEIKATHDRRSLVYPFYLIPEEGRTDDITTPKP